MYVSKLNGYDQQSKLTKKKTLLILQVKRGGEQRKIPDKMQGWREIHSRLAAKKKKVLSR